MKPEESELYRNFDRLLKWADEIRTLGIRTNADTPNDARVARLFGAQGIGLCRTEHMFFAEERILRVREMILAATRRAAARRSTSSCRSRRRLRRHLPRVDGMPVTIRLLDPPLHEFLPHTEAQISAVAREMNWGFVELRNKVDAAPRGQSDARPRGCRLGITYPEIYEMQVRAIFEAAVRREEGRRRRAARDHDPAGRHGEGAADHGRHGAPRRERGDDRSRRRRSSTSSAR